MSHADVITLPRFVARLPNLIGGLPGLLKGLQVGNPKDKEGPLGLAYCLESAVAQGGTCLTYAEFNGWANRMAHYLVSRGIHKGDTFAVMLENRPELLAVVACGGLSIPTMGATGFGYDIAHYLAQHLPKRFAQAFNDLHGWTGPLQGYKNSDIDQVATTLGQWTIKPAGTEGYRTAEVTLGGVDTRQLSSKTMAVLDRPNLFFIGEVVDMTGHLGGHNFQWAWASGVAAANSV